MARLRQGRANTARGAAHFLRETVGRVLTPGPPDHSPCGPTAASHPRRLPREARPLLHHRATDQSCATSSLLRRVDAPSILDGRRRRRGRDHVCPLREQARRRNRCGSSYAGSSPRPAPNWRCLPITATTPSSPTGTQLEADHRRHAEIENAIRDQVRGRLSSTAWGSTISPRDAPRQWGLAGRASDGPQSGPLDNAHRPGRAGGNHQDPPATLLLPGRTAHSLGPPPHFASAPGLALAEPVQQRSGPIARPAAPLLTTPTASDRPPHYLQSAP